MFRMKRKLPTKRSWNRDCDPAIVSPSFYAEERARLDRRRVDVLPTNKSAPGDPCHGGELSYH